MDKREELLRRLVRFERPLEALRPLLGAYAWDSDRELVRVAPADVKNVLTLFREDQATAGDIEAWANAIEGRDDLAMTEHVADAIFELANPLLTEPLTKERALALVEKLGSQSDAG